MTGPHTDTYRHCTVPFRLGAVGMNFWKVQKKILPLTTFGEPSRSAVWPLNIYDWLQTDRSQTKNRLVYSPHFWSLLIVNRNLSIAFIWYDHPIASLFDSIITLITCFYFCHFYKWPAECHTWGQSTLVCCQYSLIHVRANTGELSTKLFGVLTEALNWMKTNHLTLILKKMVSMQFGTAQNL